MAKPRKKAASKKLDSKKMYIMLFALPTLRSVSAFLRMKDVNSTGSDDDAARAIDIAVDALDKWLSEA